MSSLPARRGRRGVPRSRNRTASLANRGKALEDVLDDLHALYAQRREACIDRTPHPMRKVGVQRPGVFLAVDEGKGPQDYRGSVAPTGRSVVFDAKDCSADRWKLAKLEDHQAERLALAHRTGAFAFVLLRLHGRLWVLPWPALRERRQAWLDSRAARGGRAASGTASISAESLPALGHLCGVGGWLPVVRRLLSTQPEE